MRNGDAPMAPGQDDDPAWTSIRFGEQVYRMRVAPPPPARFDPAKARAEVEKALRPGDLTRDLARDTTAWRRPAGRWTSWRAASGRTRC